ncbi:MAG: hypothetical protein Q7J60_00135 [Bradyrhizobium sp.]|nr:hypothetical protein [Bradyrhizobium sp.]
MKLFAAACWRAAGVPAGIGGGLARASTSFWPDPRRPKPKQSPSSPIDRSDIAPS